MDLLKSKVIFVVLASVMVLVMIATIIWPLTEERNKAIDDQILDDFSVISSKVSTYNSQNYRVPDELDDLDLDDDVLDRAKQHDYSIKKESYGQYELCAEFKTDTRDQFDDDEDDVYRSYSSSYYSNRAHRAGFDCIEYEVYGYNYYDDFNSGGGIDLFDSTQSSPSSEI